MERPLYSYILLAIGGTILGVPIVVIAVLSIKDVIVDLIHPERKQARLAAAEEAARKREEAANLPDEELSLDQLQRKYGISKGTNEYIANQLRSDREALQTRLSNEAKSYFAKLAHLDGESNTSTSQAMGMTFIDFRSDREKRIEHDARDGVRIGTDFDALVLWLGTNEGHSRIRQIGEILNDTGGMELMQCAYYRIKARGGNAGGLERTWDGIGEWKS